MKEFNLNQETVCSFKVSENRKKVWQAELEMVKLFIGICKKLNLKYVASGGTLIGAVRHNGFIPWDDDIDIMMPRGDYERFLECGQELLPSGFFLQSNKTEKNYPNGHAQIRNSNTTCLTAMSYRDLKLNKNCGIFIDIFPYDEVPDNKKARDKQAKKVKFLRKMCQLKIYKESVNPIKAILKSIIANTYFAFHSLEKTIDKINLISKSCKGNTNTVSLISFAPLFDGNVWEKSWFEKTILHDFEDIKIAIPEQYDEVLKTEFGNYMQIPENIEGGNCHGQCYFNVDVPYTRFVGYDRNGIDRLIKESKI